MGKLKDWFLNAQDLKDRCVEDIGKADLTAEDCLLLMFLFGDGDGPRITGGTGANVHTGFDGRL